MSNHHKKNTKAEKAKFLKNLFSGKATIFDAPISTSLKDTNTWLTSDESECQNLRTHEILTKEEFLMRTKNKAVITFR